MKRLTFAMTLLLTAGARAQVTPGVPGGPVSPLAYSVIITTPAGSVMNGQWSRGVLPNGQKVIHGVYWNPYARRTEDCQWDGLSLILLSSKVVP